MTKILIVDCDKWKKIIGITLWICVTIGLGIGLYELISGTINHVFDVCTSYSDMSHWGSGKCVNWVNVTDPVIQGFIWFIALTSNVGNAICIWYVINQRLKIVELKCKNDC